MFLKKIRFLFNILFQLNVFLLWYGLLQFYTFCLNFFRFKKMFPEKVYHCPCVAFEIKLCLVNGHYSLKDICKTLNQKVNANRKIYCSKCGDNEAIFSCREHMSLKSGCEFELNNKRCVRCIKRYLKMAYCCCYDYTNFDLPLSIKKEKKVLCLIVEKL